MDGYGFATLVTLGGMMAVMLVWLWRRRPKEEKGRQRFDERQIMAQGQAYRYGFLTGVICLLGLVILQAFDSDPDYYFFIVLTIVAMLMVFVTVAVWKDAYVAIGERETPLAVSFLIWGIFRVVFSRGDVLELVMAGACLYVAGLIWVRKEVREEEDGF